MLIAHKGKIVYEAYPGMNQDDHHIWMSAAKTTVGLIFALLEAEGKVDVQKQVVDYVPELKGTNWDGITILNALNMSLGLELEETLQAITDPTSLIVRFFSAEFGQPAPGASQVEHWLDVLKEAKNIEGEEQGTHMRYCSATTTVLNYMAEKIENKPWIDIFHERVWAKVGARNPIMFHLTPEGTAVAHGLVATTLRDFARFAMLFTPSWHHAADEQVVSAEVLKRIQTAGNSAAYKKGGTFHDHRQYFGEDPDQQLIPVRRRVCRWRHVQARQPGPGHLRGPGPRRGRCLLLNQRLHPALRRGQDARLHSSGRQNAGRRLDWIRP